MSDWDKLRDKLIQEMYNQPITNTSKNKVKEDGLTLDLKATDDAYLLDINGEKVYFPTMRAYNRVLEDNKHLRSELMKLRQYINRMSRNQSIMSNQIKDLTNQLKNKQDRFD